MKIVRRENSERDRIDYGHLGFGKYFTDHMFLQEFRNGAWQEAQILPFAPLSLSPANITLHYGQTIFEGQKAFHGIDDKIRLFRPWANLARLNRSAERMCIPQVDPDSFREGLLELVRTDRLFIPRENGTSLYIRPFIFADDAVIGVKPGDSYKFMIICSPVAGYYEEGVNPVKIKVISDFARAVKGGLGEVKAAANYAASLYAARQAKQEGFAQVLWLDGREHKYVDEVGTMNIMFVIDDTLITPSLEGTILPGITRDSVLKLAAAWGWKTEERQIEIREIMDAHEKGLLQEAFGTGTAAVISPVGQLSYMGKDILINNFQTGPYAKKLYDGITGIQYGSEEDRFDWTVTVSV